MGTVEQRVLVAAVEANVPVMLWSEPGVGKSAYIESVFPTRGFHVEPVIAGHRDPSDFNGLPMVSDGEVHMAPPAWALRANSAKKSVVFLDEFSQATPMTQGACLRLLNERWAGETRIGDHVRFILAANPPECAAGGYDLAPPAANRMIHLAWSGVDAQDFSLGLTGGWELLDSDTPTLTPATDARHHQVRTLIGAFLTLHPALLHALPDDPSAAGRGWASRRSWEMLAKVLPHLPEGDMDATLVLATGCVGEGPAIEFITWMKDTDLPDAAVVMGDPGAFDWAGERMDRLFVLSSSIAHATAIQGTREAFDQAWTCVAHCADAGRTDIALMLGRRLMTVGATHHWLPRPEHIATIAPSLRASGLLND